MLTTNCNKCSIIWAWLWCIHFSHRTYSNTYEGLWKCLSFSKFQKCFIILLMWNFLTSQLRVQKRRCQFQFKCHSWKDGSEMLWFEGLWAKSLYVSLTVSYHIVASRNTCYYSENQLWGGGTNRDMLLNEKC